MRQERATPKGVESPNASRVIAGIGRRIAELRAANGWTQARFAEKLGIALQNVQRMEQGRQNFTVRTLVNVARKLGCDASELWQPPATQPSGRGRPRRARGM